jgi:predicted ATPase
MRFRKLRLKNWKNFEDTGEIEILDRLFLVGPNASGKSNFLDAFRFLRDLAASFQEAVARRGGVGALRCLAAQRYPDIELRAELEAQDGKRWTYEVAFNQDKQRRPLLKREFVALNGQTLLDRPNDDDRADPERLTQTHLEQVNVNREFRDLATFFASIHYLHIVPQLVREPGHLVDQTHDPFGGDFLEQVAKTPEKTRQSRLGRIKAALQVAIPQLQEIELWRDARGMPHFRGKYEHWRAQGAWQTEGQFSDGTLRLMGILWAVMDDQGPLLLEEPELSLHPGVVRVLPQMLARAQRRTGRQVFLSTHSPDLLNDEGIGLDEVLLLTPGREGTEVRTAGSQQDICALLAGGLPLADAIIPVTAPKQAAQLALFADR